MTPHKQCIISKNNVQKTVWIPTHCAQLNNLVALEKEVPISDYWKIEEVWDYELSIVTQQDREIYDFWNCGACFQ